MAAFIFMVILGLRLDALASSARSTDIDSSSKPAIPAQFLRELTPPGRANEFRRPRGLFVDRASGEVLVADSGNNRILIFDENGLMRFSFGVERYFSSPSSLVVDGDGYIYIVGSTASGRSIFQMDFDGVYLNRFRPRRDADTGPPETGIIPSSLAVDDQNRLYTIDQSTGHLLRLDRQGNIQHAFSLVEGMDTDTAGEIVFGAITVVRDRLYVPYSSLATIGVFDLDGQRLRSIGHKGDEAGGLNFPIGVAITQDDAVLVLDNNRFNVVCYDAQGKFLQEFGGKGYRLGWFYHPSLIAIDSQQHVYVGQIYQSWIQVCELPDLVRLNGASTKGGATQSHEATYITTN
jgi:DNA-binding beta-propeller fold protein YncE